MMEAKREMAKDFSMIESLENWVRWHYLRGSLGWPIDKVAYEMNVNEQRLREWVNARNGEMTKLMTTNAGKTEKILKDAKKRWPIKSHSEKLPNVDINKVVKLLRAGHTIIEISSKLKVKPDKFRAWYQENLQAINQRFISARLSV